ncbi:DUF3108 domain-containing protein [bacterium]|nr:DUF3108 domain-containing protein [bacterium]
MIKNIFFITLCSLFILSCSSLLKYDKSQSEFKHEEFDKKVKIVEPEEEPAEQKNTVETAPQMPVVVPEKIPTKTPIVLAKPKASKKVPKIAVAAKPLKRQPDIEDSEGFENQRRPLIDPFKVGEKVTHEVSYLGATAGELVLWVKPYAMVNGRKNYNFFIDVKSTSFFSRVYAVDDQIQTYVDFENLVPGVFKLNIRDSGQVKEAKSYFDFNSLKADYWEHKYTEKDGHQEKKINWSILPYSQNPFSAIFYMRVFKWVVGKEYSFRVADDEKNVIFKAKALEKTKLNTDAGVFNAIKLKAEVVSRGNLAKASDFYMWLSDDDHKYVLRIEVKLPVGSLVSEVTEIKEGK